MQIMRNRRPAATLSLVAMVDVLMIMLVFFMVTSTYLDLDMIPAAPGVDGAPPPEGVARASAGPLMVRIGADGRAYMRGQPLSPDALATELASVPGREVLVLPSGQADVQALVTVMDAITGAGVARMRILRLEAGP